LLSLGGLGLFGLVTLDRRNVDAASRRAWAALDAMMAA
jgi:hypothetical protein